MNQNLNYPDTRAVLSQTEKITITASDEVYQKKFTDKKDIYDQIKPIYDDIFKILWWEEFLNIRRKKIIMSVVVELLENMIKHWEVSETRDAKFKFHETEDNLFFETQNFTKTKKISDLQEKIDITSKAENDIKKIKTYLKDQLVNWTLSEEGWAGCWVFTIVKGIKKAYSELDTTDIYQQKSEGLNGIREVHIKVKMPNKDPKPTDRANKTSITKESYKD